MAGELEDIGTRLREERERVQISQRELARRIGLSASLISQIESGQSKPSVSTLYAIVTELGVSVDDVFRGSNGHSGAVHGSGEGSPGADEAPVVRSDERHVIDLDSGVRWERLTSHQHEDVDFLHVIYDVGGSSASDTMMMRHPGREYGIVHVRSPRRPAGVRPVRARAGRFDRVRFDPAAPPLEPGRRAGARHLVRGRPGRLAARRAGMTEGVVMGTYEHEIDMLERELQGVLAVFDGVSGDDWKQAHPAGTVGPGREALDGLRARRALRHLDRAHAHVDRAALRRTGRPRPRQLLHLPAVGGGARSSTRTRTPWSRARRRPTCRACSARRSRRRSRSRARTRPRSSARGTTR